MNGFPYGTTARYEDSASTIPVNFSVTWESCNPPGGVLSLFFGAKLSCNIFISILTNSIKAAELRKSIRSASYLTTQHRPLCLLQLSKPWYLSTKPRHPSIFQLGGYSPVSFSQAHPPQVSFNWEGSGTCYTPPNKTQDHQPIREIWEPGETPPDSSGLSKVADGRKGPLLVPRLWFLIEFQWRREVHSGSLRGCHKNCQLKTFTTWGLQVKFFGGQNEDCSPGDSTSESSEKLLQRGSREGQDICDLGKEGEYMQSSTYIFAADFC